MNIEATAIAFVAATKKRAQARSHLSALRKKWQDDNNAFFDKYESDGMEGYHDMVGALHDRETANAEYRRAKSRLFRVCASSTPPAPKEHPPMPHSRDGGEHDGS